MTSTLDPNVPAIVLGCGPVGQTAALCLAAWGAVSYTHLDVYKRQSSESPGPTSPIQHAYSPGCVPPSPPPNGAPDPVSVPRRTRSPHQRVALNAVVWQIYLPHNRYNCHKRAR